jgi:hypothetical protein
MTMKNTLAITAVLAFLPLAAALAQVDPQRAPDAARRVPAGLIPASTAVDGALTRPADAPATPSDEILGAREVFLQRVPGAMLSERAGRITRVYGVPLSTGRNATDSADRFVQQHVRMLGARIGEISTVGPFPDARHVQPAGWDASLEAFRYTIVGFTQQVNGIPVFQTALKLLVRHEPGWPVSLVSSDLRDLGNFPGTIEGMRVEMPPESTYAGAVLGGDAGKVRPQDASLVIFAGANEIPHEPTLAVRFVVERGAPGDAAYSKVLHVVDAADGRPLFQESLVCHLGAGIECEVRANATAGFVADPCAPEIPRAMPYSRVEWSGDITGSGFTDENGILTVPYSGTGSLSLTSRLGGQYFTVNDSGGTAVSTVSSSAAAGSAQALTHNPDNATEQLRAQVNAYLHANLVRDLLIRFNPQFPVISNQQGASAFPINVNIANTCNAFYNGSSINFYRAGGNCNNTAFGTVVHHEYGHHIVGMAGSGQGEYGEGFSDVVGLLVTDNPRLADGFSTCGVGIRRADNTCQYLTSGCSTCGSTIHSCGQLISGCVWDTRLLLEKDRPGQGLDIIRRLALDSVLLHTGTAINPDITVDFMVLDDDNALIGDGTPHYEQIQAGFSAHGMPGPALAPIIVDYPFGTPEYAQPNGLTRVRARVRGVMSSLVDGTALLRWRVTGSSSFSDIAMTSAGGEVFEANLPALGCGTTIEWFVQAMAASGETITAPANAPATLNRSQSAYGTTLVFRDDFEQDRGWTVGAPTDNATAGTWVRVDPNGTGAQPEDDASPKGTQCFITGQGPVGGAVGLADVDGGTTTLTSPAVDASGGGNTYLRYARWYSNNTGAAPNADSMPIEVSNNNGATWTQLELVTENAERWAVRNWRLNDVFPTLGTQFRVRYLARDLSAGSLVEAGVDDFEIYKLRCEPALAGDLDGDGIVAGIDLAILLSAWGSPSADLDGDGTTNGIDLTILLGSWTGG